MGIIRAERTQLSTDDSNKRCRTKRRFWSILRKNTNLLTAKAAISSLEGHKTNNKSVCIDMGFKRTNHAHELIDNLAHLWFEEGHKTIWRGGGGGGIKNFKKLEV